MSFCVLVSPITSQTSQLEFVSLCANSAVQADKSGVISYDPSSGSDCHLTLAGLQQGDGVALLGLNRGEPSISCKDGESLVKLNGGMTYCTGDPKSVYNIITNTSSGQLQLDLVTPGSKDVRMEYYYTRRML